MSWIRNPIAEKAMKAAGLKFEFKTGIPLARVRSGKSRNVNARMTPLDMGYVKKIAYDLKNGADIFAPILDNEGYVCCGNHRIAGNKDAGFNAIDAYVITDGEQSAIDKFLREDNNRHGLRPTREDTIVSCVELHRLHGFSIRDLANEFFGPEDNEAYSSMLRANQAKDVEIALNENKISIRNFNRSQLESLHPLLVMGAKVLHASGNVVSTYKLPVTVVEDMVKAIKAKPNEAERLQVIEQARKDRADIVHGKTDAKIAPEVILQREMAKFLRFLQTGNAGKEFPLIGTFSPKPKKELREIATSVINLLKHLKEKV